MSPCEEETGVKLIIITNNNNDIEGIRQTKRITADWHRII